MADTQTRIIKALKKAGKPLDDDGLAAVLGIERQHVNQAARKLQERKRTLRVQGPTGKLVNVLNDRAGRRTVSKLPRPATEDSATRDGRLSEDEVKRAVAEHLKSEGWDVQVA